MLHHLLKDRLNKEGIEYQIYLSQRGKNNMQFFQKAIEKALERDNTRRKKPITVKFKCDIVLSNQYPELSIVDYLLWALQRYILKGEDRFFMALRDKYNLIIDLYDTEHYKGKEKENTNYYTTQNPFDVKKASNFDK